MLFKTLTWRGAPSVYCLHTFRLVLKNILGYCETPLVSIDFKGNKLSSIVDADLTMSVNNRMLKVLAWYDNEWGYSNRLIELAEMVASKMNATAKAMSIK